jgi:phage recombination protein Bet
MNTAAPSTTVAVQPQPQVLLLDSMAMKYGLRPQEFADTVRKTCGLVTATAEEFAAFVMVAKEYNLNPILKEIYAFPRQGGGIVPIVSIDGWVNLINSHKALDGITFEMQHAENGDLLACTCRIYRKDRTHPIEVTEYYDECRRDTVPWKMKHRMLRHKSLIQCSRYAFGFSGIYDEDEGVVIAASTTATPKPPRPTDTKTPPKPTEQKQPPRPANDQQGELAGKDVEDAQVEDVSFTREEGDPGHDPETGEVVDEAQDQGEPTIDPSDQLTRLETALEKAAGALDVEEIWNDMDLPSTFSHLKDADDWIGMARKIKDRFLKNLKNAKGGK